MFLDFGIWLEGFPFIQPQDDFWGQVMIGDKTWLARAEEKTGK